MKKFFSENISAGIAIIIILFAIPLFIPIIGDICFAFTPIPILFYRLNLGRNKAWMLVFMAIAILLLVSPNFPFYFIMFCWLLLFGLILSELIELKLPIERTIVITCFLSLMIAIIFLFVYSSIVNKEISEVVKNFVAENLKLILAIYKDAGLFGKESEFLFSDTVIAKLEFFLAGITPSLLISFTMILSWITILLAERIFEKNKFSLPDLEKLNRKKAPEYLIWYAAGSGLALLLPVGGWKIVASNIIILLATIYFIYGIAILGYYFDKKKLSTIVKCCLYFIVVTNQILFFILVGIGFFDTWFNFRKIERNGV